MDETLDLGLGIKAAGAVEAQRTTKSLIGTLKDYVKGIFKVQDATQSSTKAYSAQMSTMNSADAVYQKMGDSFSKLKRRFLAFVGVYAASDIFTRLYEEGRKVEDMVVRLANRFGSDKIGNQMTRWVNETVSRLPVARDELEQYITTLDEIALPASLTNLEGVLNASLNTGQDLNSVLGQLIEFSKSNDVVGLTEFFAGRISPQEISQQLAGAQSIQERVVRLTELMDQKFEGNIQRTRRTIGGQLEILSSIARQFKQNVIGFAGSGGFYDEIKAFINDFVGWFEVRKDSMVEFAQEIQYFLLQMFRFVRKNFLNMGDFTEGMFQTIRRFIRNSRELVNPFVLFIAILTERMKSFLTGFIEGYTTFFVDLKNLIQGTVGMLNEFLAPFLSEDVKSGLRGLTGLFSDLFSASNVEDFGKLIGNITGAITTFIAVSWGLTKVVGWIKGIGAAWTAVSTAMLANPWVAAITAVVGAILLLNRAWKDNWFEIQQTMEPVVSWVKGALESTGEYLVNLWSSVSNEVSSFVSEITPALEKIWTVLKPISKILLVGLVENLKRVGKFLWSFVKGTFTISVNSIVNAWKIAWEFVSGTIESFLKLLTGDFSGAWDSFTDMVSGIAEILGDQFKMVGSSVLGFFKETGEHVLGFFEGFWSKTKKMFIGIFNWFIERINAYILEPLNSVSSKLGFQIPSIQTIDSESRGSKASGSGKPQMVNRSLADDPSKMFQFQPAKSDATSTVNEFNGNIEINVPPSDNPAQTAQFIRKELEKYYRRERERTN